MQIQILERIYIMNDALHFILQSSLLDVRKWRKRPKWFITYKNISAPPDQRKMHWYFKKIFMYFWLTTLLFLTLPRSFVWCNFILRNFVWCYESHYTANFGHRGEPKFNGLYAYFIFIYLFSILTRTYVIGGFFSFSFSFSLI